MDPVEVHARADRRVERRREEGELAAHAEPHRAELLRGRLAQQVGRGAAQIALGLRDVERHEELAGAVGLAGRLAVVHVRGERREAFGGERSQTFLMCPTRPHHSWSTSTPGHFPEAGVARYAAVLLPFDANSTIVPAMLRTLLGWCRRPARSSPR